MNIFYLDPNPKTCAEMHCDKHVVKMIIEYAQLMSTAHRILDGKEYIDLTANGRKIKRWQMENPKYESELMKASHINHPSAVWVRASKSNYVWLLKMWLHLLAEYTHRYGKRHACEKYIDVLYTPPNNIRDSLFTEPTPAMPDFCKVKNDSIQSYRNYYVQCKQHLWSWKGKINSRKEPVWFEQMIIQQIPI
jgi:hypothetical protein